MRASNKTPEPPTSMARPSLCAALGSGTSEEELVARALDRVKGSKERTTTRTWAPILYCEAEAMIREIERLRSISPNEQCQARRDKPMTMENEIDNDEPVDLTKPASTPSPGPTGSEPSTALDTIPPTRRLRSTTYLAWANGILVQWHTSDLVGDNGAWIKVPVIPND